MPFGFLRSATRRGTDVVPPVAPVEELATRPMRWVRSSIISLPLRDPATVARKREQYPEHMLKKALSNPLLDEVRCSREIEIENRQTGIGTRRLLPRREFKVT